MNLSNNSLAFTSETKCIISGIELREARLVGVSIHGVYSSLPTSTLSTRLVDGIPDATIHQPAGSTLIEALFPGCVELPGGGEDGVVLLAAGNCFVIGETLSGSQMENLTCGADDDKMQGGK